MTLDNNIRNSVAGYTWLAIGFLGTAWLGLLQSDVRNEIGGWRRYYFGPEPSQEAKAKVAQFRKRMWAFVAAWLALYLFLDWLF